MHYTIRYLHDRNPDVQLVYVFHGTGRIPCGSPQTEVTLVSLEESVGAKGVPRYYTTPRV